MNLPSLTFRLLQDGVAFHSHTMKRVRKVMDESSRNRPGDRLIDMHSGNSFPEAATSNAYPNFSYPSILNLTCQFGCVSPALCYMQSSKDARWWVVGQGHSIPA